MVFSGMDMIRKAAKVTGKIASEVITHAYDIYLNYVNEYKEAQ